jgi:hypothetical protein
MKTRTILIILIIAPIILCCRKNDMSGIREIKTGTHENMIINNYDTLFSWKNNSPNFYYVDIDKNGENDIEIASEISGPRPIVGYSNKFVITCLNSNIQLLVNYSADTIFLEKKVRLSYYADNSVEKYLYSNYRCQRITSRDSVFKIIQSYQLIQLEDNDIIRMDNTFKSDTFTIREQAYSDPPEALGIVSDTAVFEQKTYYNDCYNFPFYKVRYIGLKQKNEKLGWIKILLLNDFKLFIFESGIQQ